MNAVIVPLVTPLSVRRILVAVDFSLFTKPAVRAAAAVARHFGSEVHLMHVMSVLPITPGELVAPAALFQAAEDRARNALERTSRHSSLKNLERKLFLSQGDVALAVREYIQQFQIDLLVVGTHGRTGVTHVLLGSTAEELVRSASCPVLTVGPSLEDRFRTLERVGRILYPSDLAPASRKVLPLIAGLAAEEGSCVTVLRVLPASFTADLDHSPEVNALLQSLKRTLDRNLSPKCGVQFRFTRGDTAGEILREARNGYDLIVMGVKHAGAMATHLPGTVHSVLAGSPCPVLTWMDE